MGARIFVEDRRVASLGREPPSGIENLAPISLVASGHLEINRQNIII